MASVLILPITCYLLYDMIARRKEAFADSLAKTILLFEALLLLMVNLLSVGSRLGRWSVFAFWLLCIAVLLLIGAKRFGRAYFRSLLRLDAVREPVGRLLAVCRSFSAAQWLMAAGASALLLILLFGALFTVPYNYDSMTYHLARVGYWADHGNVNYYVTNIDRQLFSPVLSEYNLLTVMLLAGNDVLLNLVQYIGMLLSAYYLYKLARMLKVGRSFSMFASFAYLTMPLTVSQAITTQNDLSAGLFFLLFVYELLWFVQAAPAKRETEHGKESGDNVFAGAMLTEKSILIGAAVGFAFLMKVSVCVSMVMFMPWVFATCIRRRDSLLSLLRAGVIALLSMLCVILETLVRTWQACGSLIAPATSGDIMVATKNISYIIVNILKNYSLLITQHVLTALNGFVYRIAIHVGALLHVEVNNIAIAYHGFDFITYLNMGDDMYSHDRTPSAFVSYLALFAGVLLVIALLRLLVWSVRGRQPEKKPFRGRQVSYGYVISAWLGFGFIMALLRWQPWGSRLMYPALTMTIVAAAHLLDVFCDRWKEKIGIVVLPLALLSALLCGRSVAYNLRPAVEYVKDGCQNRMQYYFVHNDRSEAYRELLKIAKKDLGATDIAVVISGDGYDYPLWKMFHDSMPDATLRHILVDDTNMKTEKPALTGCNIDGANARGRARTCDEPDCILWIERGRLEVGQTLDYFGATYECIFVSDSEKAPDSLLVKR